MRFSGVDTLLGMRKGFFDSGRASRSSDGNSRRSSEQGDLQQQQQQQQPMTLQRTSATNAALASMLDGQDEQPRGLAEGGQDGDVASLQAQLQGAARAMHFGREQVDTMMQRVCISLSACHECR